MNEELIILKDHLIGFLVGCLFGFLIVATLVGIYEIISMYFI